MQTKPRSRSEVILAVEVQLALQSKSTFPHTSPRPMLFILHFWTTRQLGLPNVTAVPLPHAQAEVLQTDPGSGPNPCPNT